MEKIEPVVRKNLKFFLRKNQFYLHRLKYPDYQKLKNNRNKCFSSKFFSHIWKIPDDNFIEKKSSLSLSRGIINLNTELNIEK